MIIYKVTNKTNGKSYIGQSVRNIKMRRGEHLRSSQRLIEQKYPTPLHVAISAEGSGNFTWDVLETCVSKDTLNEREKYYIKLYKTLVPDGYNQTTGGAIDSTMCEATRFKIAETMRKHHKDPAYQTANYSQLKGRTPPNKGVAMSEEQKTKLSAARKAVHEDPDYVNPNVGQKRQGEALKNVQEGHKRRKLPKGEAWHAAHANQYTEEVRIKMRAAKIGKKPANTKKILCIETGQVFAGLTECAEKLAINRQSVYLQIKGKIKRVAGKYTFQYLEETI